MKPLQTIVAATVLSAGVVGCNDGVPHDINYPLLIDHAHRVEATAEKLLSEPEKPKPLPPKEKSASMVFLVEDKDGEKVYQRIDYVVKDLPPTIKKVDFLRDHVSVTIINKGLNHRYLEYIAVVDLEKGTAVSKSSGSESPFNGHCWVDDGVSDEGKIILRYCSFRKKLWFDKLKEPGTYKYIVEVKDHYHTVRSEPFTIRIEEAK